MKKIISTILFVALIQITFSQAILVGDTIEFPISNNIIRYNHFSKYKYGKEYLKYDEYKSRSATCIKYKGNNHTLKMNDNNEIIYMKLYGGLTTNVKIKSGQKISNDTALIFNETTLDYIYESGMLLQKAKKEYNTSLIFTGISLISISSTFLINGNNISNPIILYAFAGSSAIAAITYRILAWQHIGKAGEAMMKYNLSLSCNNGIGICYNF